MSDFHKELLSELTEDWNIQQLETYIYELQKRAVELNDWIKHVKTIRRKKVRKPPVDTGTRGGKG